jgi:hypothetical protein
MIADDTYVSMWKKKSFVAYFKALLSDLGHAVAQLVEALHYKPEGRGFDSQLCQWHFSLT